MSVTQIRGAQILNLTLENAQIATSANIALSKLANGTKIMLDDSAQLQADLDANSNKITNLADGTAAGDGVNYSQLQNVATQGKLWKEVLFTGDQLLDGSSGGIYAGQTITLSANLQAGDTVTLNDGSATENYIAGTDFTIGASINATLSNLATAITSGSIALTAVTGALDSLDDTNDVLVMWQDTIGEPTRVYGNAAAAVRVSIADSTMDNMYESASTDLVTLPTSDPSATNFGFSRAVGSLAVNETHMSRLDDSSYTWDNDADVWNMTGATSIPYASTTTYGKVKVNDGITVSSGVIGLDLTSNEGLKLDGSSPDKTLAVDYDNSTIGMVGTQLGVLTDGINDTHIDWGTGANQVSQDDVVDGSTYKQYDPTNVAITGGSIDGVSAGNTTPLTSLNVDNVQIDGNTISTTDSNGNLILTPNGTGEVDISKVDIDSGTIDGVTMATSDITVGAGKTLDVSLGTLTLSDNQISGDKVEGGTIAAITITNLTATSADIDGGSVDGATLGTNSAITEAQIDNINIDGNAITSTDTNGNITLTPNGTGEVDISKVDIDSGTIDNVAIGSTTAATIVNVDNLALDGNTLSSTDTNGDINITPDGTGEVNITKVDIDGGAIDNTIIGANSPAAGYFTNITLDGLSLYDTDDSNTMEVIWNENDTADRTFNLLVGGGDRSLTMNENLIIEDGFDVSITSEDAASSIVYDNANFEVENLNATQRDLKISIGTDANAAISIEGVNSAINQDLTTDANVTFADMESTTSSIGNIDVVGNTISTTDVNGDLTLAPNGTGAVVIGNADINGGAVDGITLGTNSPVTEAQVDNVNINGNTISSTDANGNIILDPNGTGSISLNSSTITGSGVLDEDDFASDSDTQLATQQSIKAYVDSAGMSNYVVNETPSGSVDGANTTFTLANTPDAGTVQVFLNGLLQLEGAGNDYTISGDTITYLSAPLSGDVLRITYVK